MTQTEAEAALGRFIRARAAQGAACLLVITGKGRAGGGVLRARFLDWVNAADIRPLLSGYSQAHARHGGEGAYYLFIRSSAAAAAFHRGPT
jgi:DNA-nicking Smr family endonuclease